MLTTNYTTSTYGKKKQPRSSHAYIGSKFSILQCVLKICKYRSSLIVSSLAVEILRLFPTDSQDQPGT